MGVPRVLIIAGSDSGAGAGIQADLKATAAQGVYGMTAITALTAQNTTGVQGIFPVSPDFVGQQIDSVMEDIGADVWKIGMLANAGVIEVVSARARDYGVSRIVLDPVMVAKGGDALLASEAQEALIELLLPLASVVTPNHHEAQALTSIAIQTLDDMRRAARAIHSLGAKAVVVKGGHLPEEHDAVDILFEGESGTFSTYTAPRQKTANTHGTGCSFASSLAACLAKGLSLQDAVKATKAYINLAIEGADALDIGKGHGPLDHFHWHL